MPPPPPPHPPRDAELPGIPILSFAVLLQSSRCPRQGWGESPLPWQIAQQRLVPSTPPVERACFKMPVALRRTARALAVRRVMTPPRVGDHPLSGGAPRIP